jgi:hypothetical protein
VSAYEAQMHRGSEAEIAQIVRRQAAEGWRLDAVVRGPATYSLLAFMSREKEEQDGPAEEAYTNVGYWPRTPYLGAIVWIVIRPTYYVGPAIISAIKPEDKPLLERELKVITLFPDAYGNGTPRVETIYGHGHGGTDMKWRKTWCWPDEVPMTENEEALNR